MHPDDTADHRPADQRPPRRDCEAGMRLARLAVGHGVVCGLDVSAAEEGDERGLTVSPGLAMDPLGRELVLPDRMGIVPLPDSGSPSTPMVVRLRYREGAGAEGHSLAVEPHAAGARPAGYGPEVLDLVRRGALAEALDALARDACADPPADPSVVLAGVSRAADGSIVVDRRPRETAATNRSLLQLIACLVALVEEGRGGHRRPRRSKRAKA